jgi:negative regulator of flagellin synthesis FlgM
MKINEPQRSSGINPYMRANHSASVNGSDKKTKAKDEVQISAQAKELLESQYTDRSAERSQRIEDLKQSVSSGTYYVEAGVISEKLLPYIK